MIQITTRNGAQFILSPDALLHEMLLLQYREFPPNGPIVLISLTAAEARELAAALIVNAEQRERAKI